MESKERVGRGPGSGGQGEERVRLGKGSGRSEERSRRYLGLWPVVSGAGMAL